jgi:hypothetical protein
MSQNMIVSWRRSAEEAGVAGGVGRGPVEAASGGLPGTRPAPHSEQNRAWAELACPQARHSRGSAEPQCSQNLLPSFRLALQLGHCMVAPPNARGQPSISRCQIGQTGSGNGHPPMSALWHSVGLLDPPMDVSCWHEAPFAQEPATLVRWWGYSASDPVVSAGVMVRRPVTQGGSRRPDFAVSCYTRRSFSDATW